MLKKKKFNENYFEKYFLKNYNALPQKELENILHSLGYVEGAIIDQTIAYNGNGDSKVELKKTLHYGFDKSNGLVNRSIDSAGHVNISIYGEGIFNSKNCKLAKIIKNGI